MHVCIYKTNGKLKKQHFSANQGLSSISENNTFQPIRVYLPSVNKATLVE